MANLFPDITPGITTGSTAATNLNNLGRSDEIAIKVVSGSDVLTTESGYYKEGTLVFSKNEKKIYELSSGSFIDSGSTIAPNNRIFSTGDIRQVELYRSTLSGSGIFDVSNISQDYDHLLLRLSLQSSDTVGYGDHAVIYLNNDTTASNYRSVSPNYTVANSANLPLVATIKLADAISSYDVMISRYTDTLFSKNMYFYGGGQGDSTYYNVGTIRWLSSGSPITRVTVRPDNYPTDVFTVGSFLQIIGIKTV